MRCGCAPRPARPAVSGPPPAPAPRPALLADWLLQHDLAAYAELLAAEGITKLDHLQDADDELVAAVNMKPAEKRRFNRERVALFGTAAMASGILR